MRIDRIHIDGFGRAEDITLSPSPGLTLIRGPNGAGKTTVHQFLHAMLFGLVKDRYPLVRGGRRGGTLSGVTADGRRYEITRHGDPITGAAQKLSVRIDGLDVPNAERAVAAIIGGVTRHVFESIFAFGQDELRDISRLTSEGVADRIYGASIGVVADVLKVEAKIEAERDAVWKARGSVPVINSRLAEIEHLDYSLRGRDLPAEYAGLRRDVERLEQELAERDVDLAALRTRRNHVALVLAAKVPWQRAAEVRRALAGLPDEPPVSAEDLSREAALAKAAQIAAERAVNLRAARELLDTQLAEATFRKDVIDRAVEIDAAVTSAGNWRSRADDIKQRSQRAAALRTLVDGAVADAGWDEERLRGTDLNALRRGLAQHATDDLDLPARETAAPDAMARSEAEGVSRLRDRLAAVELELQSTPVIDDAVAESLDSQVQSIERDLAVADALRAQIGAVQPPRIRKLGALPAVFGAISLAVVGGGVVVWLARPLPGLVLLAFGLVGSAVALLLEASRRRRNTPSEHPGVAQLREREEAIGGRWSALELQGLPTIDGLEPARAEAARMRTGIEMLRRLERDRNRIAEELATREQVAANATALSESAQAAVKSGAERWVTFLKSSALATTLDRETANGVLARLEGARAALGELDELRLAMAKTNRELQTWNAGVVRLARDLGVMEEEDGDVLVELMRQELANARTSFRVREDLAGRRDAAGTAERAADGLVATAEREHLDLLLAFGVTDAAALAARQTRTVDRTRLQGALHQAEEALSGMIPAAERASVTADLESVDAEALEGQRDALEEDIAQRQGARDELAEAIGERREQVRQLATAADTSAIRQRLADERGAIAAEAREWLVRRIAGELLRSTRGHYEAKHRPAVLARAEALFVAWTDGEYSGFDRLSASGLDAVTRADDGKRVPVSGLSRGTGEQLYLAMRVALVEHLATQQEPLPLVMDDVLVNFDPDRGPRVARSIEEISQTRQVIYLTCHRDVALRPDRIIEVGGNVEVRSTVDSIKSAVGGTSPPGPSQQPA